MRTFSRVEMEGLGELVGWHVYVERWVVRFSKMDAW